MMPRRGSGARSTLCDPTGPDVALGTVSSRGGGGEFRGRVVFERGCACGGVGEVDERCTRASCGRAWSVWFVLGLQKGCVVLLTACGWIWRVLR